MLPWKISKRIDDVCGDYPEIYAGFKSQSGNKSPDSVGERFNRLRLIVEPKDFVFKFQGSSPNSNDEFCAVFSTNSCYGAAQIIHDLSDVV